MSRVLAFVYGVVTYAIFLVTFLYAIGFIEGRLVPKSINSGPTGSVPQAVLINVLLLGLFGLQHSVMARPGFKRWWTRFVPRPIERSTFVLVTCCVLALLFWQWRPITSTVWSVEAGWARTLLTGLSAFGWLLVLYSSFVIDHFDLFGVRQVLLYLRGRNYVHPPFMERSVYKLVRHPLMVGFLVAFWATPHMTGGHVLFAVVATGYILVGITLEERDLLQILGEDYRLYRARTPLLLPRPRSAKPVSSPRNAPMAQSSER